MEEDGNFLSEMDFNFTTFPTDQFTADPTALEQQQQVLNTYHTNYFNPQTSFEKPLSQAL